MLIILKIISRMYDKVNDYYLKNLGQLPFTKQFHYMSRLWLWYKDLAARNWLDEHRTEICGAGTPTDINHKIEEIIGSQRSDFGTKHAVAERAPYFEKYPLLKPSSLVLFRLLYLESIYDIDAKHLLSNHFDADQLTEMNNQLLNDVEAVAVLSTHAVNFIHLFAWFQNQPLSPATAYTLFEIGQTQYNPTDKLERLLLVYLYSHCIIGDTHFYARNLPTTNIDTYNKMLTSLEKLITNYYDDTSLDNKFEFLVCSRLCNSSSLLEQKVLEEAADSFSSEGDFVIDTHNSYQGAGNHSFEDSEHRNILLVMATKPSM